MLDPILTVSGGVSDTNELFIRSYQMVQMFERKEQRQESVPRKAVPAPKLVTEDTADTYAELKIGKVAQLVLKPILESGNVPDDEIEQLQDKAYSKKVLDLNFPLLVRQDAPYDKLRYYKDPVIIMGTAYMMCSQWVERPDNNDRPYLMKWIQEHQ